MSTRQRTGLIGRIPFIRGAAAGVVAYVAGYLATYTLLELDSGLAFTLSAADYANPPTVAGWYFYSAQFVPLNAKMLGERTTFDLLSAQYAVALPSLLYYLVPVTLVFGAGLLVGASVNLRGISPVSTALAGPTVGLGYLPLVVFGAVAFGIRETRENAIGETFTYSAGPDVARAIIIPGFLYPIIIGTAGALVGLAIGLVVSNILRVTSRRSARAPEPPRGGSGGRPMARTGQQSRPNGGRPDPRNRYPPQSESRPDSNRQQAAPGPHSGRSQQRSTDVSGNRSTSQSRGGNGRQDTRPRSDAPERTGGHSGE